MRGVTSYIILFIVLVLIQIFICNHILLFNVAFPIVFIYFILRLPVDINKSLLFTLSFALGFVIDVLSDTPGINALSCTLIAAIKQPLLYAYIPRDDRTSHISPSINSLGVSIYSKLLLSFVGIYCLISISLEYFSFADVKDIVIMSASSTVLTFAVLLGIDSLIISKK